MPGMTRASVLATCSKVLWSSFSTMTIQLPPNPAPGSPVRGRSTVSVLMIGPRCASMASAPGGGAAEPELVESGDHVALGVLGAAGQHLQLSPAHVTRAGIGRAGEV